MGDQISDFDRTHVGQILAGHGTWFSALLLRLMAHSDARNFAKLQAAFPDHAEAYLDWRSGKVSEDVSLKAVPRMLEAEPMSAEAVMEREG